MSDGKHLRADLSGDGREIIRPAPDRPEPLGDPLKLRRSAAHQIIHLFLANGQHFSRSGGTAWVIQEYCYLNRLPCFYYKAELEGEPVGYHIDMGQDRSEADRQKAVELTARRIRWVSCGICGTPTDKLGTQRCNACWELETRIRHNPERAALLLRQNGYKVEKL